MNTLQSRPLTTRPAPPPKLFPSRFAIGEKVILNLNEVSFYAFIRAITFTSGKVRYALYIKESQTTLHNIDSVFVEPVPSDQKEFIEFDFDNFS